MNRYNCNTLRIDMPDGSSVVEYRIRHDSVETRTLPAEHGDGTGNEWQRLTPEQIDYHITRSTIVAYWLRRRIGVRRLIQTCSDAMSGLRDPNAVHLLVRKLASLPSLYPELCYKNYATCPVANSRSGPLVVDFR